MAEPLSAAGLLRAEAFGLLSRLDDLEPFSTCTPMVAAAYPQRALQAVEFHLAAQARLAKERIRRFIGWLDHDGQNGAGAARQQRRFALLRLQFNALTSQYDIFADAFSQRSDHAYGMWLAALDLLAADAMKVAGDAMNAPVLCYLDRGIGAAIRRSRTRLPGGGSNPVAIIRVPRERMVGLGIASSLVHETGHQVAATYNWIPSIRQPLAHCRQADPANREAWVLWERWISEILSDFWAVAQLGVTGTFGLFSVVSLPRPCVLRIKNDDPQPFPWIRFHISCAIGQALYPHSQWERLSLMWNSLYPPTNLSAEQVGILRQLVATMPRFVDTLLNCQPAHLRGLALRNILDLTHKQPDRLSELAEGWINHPRALERLSPVLALATIGQARWDGLISPHAEGQLLRALFRRWAISHTRGSNPPIAQAGVRVLAHIQV